MDGLNEAGQPEGYRAGEERDHGLIRLRQNEYAIGAFRCRGGWFAIPERGSLLRYLKPSPDGALMERLASIQGMSSKMSLVLFNNSTMGPTLSLSA